MPPSLEHTVLPLFGEQEFGLESKTELRYLQHSVTQVRRGERALFVTRLEPVLVRCEPDL
jgi:hypothetical protein